MMRLNVSTRVPTEVTTFWSDRCINGFWRCTCRDWPFSWALKPIDLGLGFQVHWVHMQVFSRH
jgi:hypothetical protein